MKSRTLIVVIFMISSSFAPPQNTREEVIVNNESYRLKKFIIRNRDLKTTIYAAIIDPRKVRVKIEGLTQKYSNGRRAIEVSRSGAKVVLGGGFMTSFYPIIPNGFLKIDKTTITGLKSKGYNGVAGVKKSELMLVSANSQSTAALDEGFQTGPFLIRDSKVVFKPTTEASRQPYNRAFIGFTQQGKLLAAITTEPVTLQDLSKYLLNAEFPELTCKSLLNLAGGGSETLVVRGQGNSTLNYGSYTDNQSALIAFY